MVNTNEKIKNLNNTWRVLVVDDEVMSRDHIKNILRQRHPDFDVVAEAESIYKAIWPLDDPKYMAPAYELLTCSGRIDGIILDINIDSEPKNVAIDFALAVSRLANPPWVIFITGNIENSKKAHGVHILDFWEKAYDMAKIDNTLDWVRKNRPVINSSRLSIKHRVIINKSESEWQTRFVAAEEIRFIQKDNNANTAHVRLINNETLKGINTTLANWEAQLRPFDFVKINRGCLVNRKLIKGTRTTLASKTFVTFLNSSDEISISAEHIETL
jgi:DNA-binding LytR/AlgR family response regulator